MIRTLIVDDDFMVANIHRGFTERLKGFEVVGTAHSGSDALAAAERLHPDLVILDIYLPDRSGLDVLQELRRLSPGADVIMVTAAKDVASVQQAMQGGAIQYIIKPFSFARYQQALETYLQLRQRRAALGTVEQVDVDRMYTLIGAAAGASVDLPKGLNQPTLELVVKQLREKAEPLSAQETALGVGVSRSTARRYLGYLVASGRATRQLRYGAAGRPENLYELL